MEETKLEDNGEIALTEPVTLKTIDEAIEYCIKNWWLWPALIFGPLKEREREISLNVSLFKEMVEGVPQIEVAF